jgi:hypothetical protein
MSTKKTNVDTDYNRQIKQFLEDYKQLPTKQKNLTELQTNYEQLTKIPIDQLEPQEITKIQQLKEQIDLLKQDVENSHHINK